jgi:hypothetical protein
MRGVLSHLKHAVATGFVTMPRSDRPHTAQPSGTPKSEAPLSAPGVETSDGRSIGPGCTGYDEVR